MLVIFFATSRPYCKSCKVGSLLATSRQVGYRTTGPRQVLQGALLARHFELSGPMGPRQVLPGGLLARYLEFAPGKLSRNKLDLSTASLSSPDMQLETQMINPKF